MGAVRLTETIQWSSGRHAKPAPDVHRTKPRRSSRKWAKRIRKILGYKPTDKRLYLDSQRAGNEKFKEYGGTFLANCSRVRYQLMKGREG